MRKVISKLTYGYVSTDNKFEVWSEDPRALIQLLLEGRSMWFGEDEFDLESTQSLQQFVDGECTFPPTYLRTRSMWLNRVVREVASWAE